MSNNNRQLSYADALEQVTADDLSKYPNQVVAVSLVGLGIIGAETTLEELAAAVESRFPDGHPYAWACGPQR